MLLTNQQATRYTVESVNERNMGGHAQARWAATGGHVERRQVGKKFDIGVLVQLTAAH
jgi:hypothetical protein